MIVMDLKLDNFLGFSDFKVNFTYPKKLVSSTIEKEYLPNKPNFRFKRVNILMGSNATGKTSIGKALMYIFNFLTRKGSYDISKYINNKRKEAKFSIDFLVNEDALFRVDASFIPKIKNELSNVDISLDVYKASISSDASYETTVKKLKKIVVDPDAENTKYDYIKKLDMLPLLSWIFTFPNEGANSLLSDPDKILDLKIVKAVLSTLDPCISDVEKSKDGINNFVIKHMDSIIIVDKGEITDKSKQILSSGTVSGLEISYILSSAFKNKHGFFYCDEKFSYIQSDIEKNILSVLISYLEPMTQLFFTTHNLDIADLDLPIHSYLLLKKEKDIITAINPEKQIRRNDVTLRNYLENDNFCTTPNLSHIQELGDLK